MNDTQDGERFLRPEELIQSFDKLTHGQKRAYRRTVACIYEAVGDSASLSAVAERYASLPFDYYQESRIVFIDGEKGSGKSTLLKSLVLGMIPERRLSGRLDSLAKWSGPTELKKKLRSIRDSIAILDWIDLGPVVGDANLLAAVLVRLRAATEKHLRSTQSGRLAKRKTAKLQVRDELEQLELRVRGAWGSSVHAQTLSSSDEAIFERDRMRFSRDLAVVLDGIVREWGLPKTTVFLLPIDDIDLHPSKCRDLLRLIELLSVPRLFIVAAGSVQMVQEVCHRSIAADILDVGPPAFERGVEETMSLTETLGSELVEKLLPPGQRIRLDAMTRDEVLDYRPEKNSRSIRELLTALSVDLSRSPVPGDENWLARSGRASIFEALFRVTPRKAADWWIVISRMRNESSTSQDVAESPHLASLSRLLLLRQDGEPGSLAPPRIAVALLSVNYRDAVSDDETLSQHEKLQLRGAVSRDYRGVSQFDPSSVRMIIRQGPETRVALRWSELCARAPRDWGFRPISRGDERGRWLKDRTAASLVACHDVHALGSGTSFLGSSMVTPLWNPYSVPSSDDEASAIGERGADRANTFYWCSAEWDSSVRTGKAHIAWRLPRLRSFWEYNYLRESWNLALERAAAGVDAHIPERVASEGLVAYLAYCWGKSASLLLAGRNPLLFMTLEEFLAGERNDHVVGKIDNLPSVLGELDQRLHGAATSWASFLLRDFAPLLDELRQGSPTYARRQALLHWAAAMCGLVAPESGLPLWTTAVFSVTNSHVDGVFSNPLGGDESHGDNRDFEKYRQLVRRMRAEHLACFHAVDSSLGSAIITPTSFLGEIVEDYKRIVDDLRNLFRSMQPTVGTETTSQAFAALVDGFPELPNDTTDFYSRALSLSTEVNQSVRTGGGGPTVVRFLSEWNRVYSRLFNLLQLLQIVSSGAGTGALQPFVFRKAFPLFSLDIEEGKQTP